MSERPPPLPPAPGDVLEAIDVPEATRTALAAIACLGLGFDLTFNGQRPGLAIPLLALGLATSIRRIAVRSPATDVLLASAVVIAVFPALLASPPLAAFDVVAAAALLALAATQDRGSITSETVPGLVRRALTIVVAALEVPRSLTAPFVAPGERSRLR